MITRKTGLLFALALPILALASNVLYHHYKATQGTEVVLPIQAYDPRSLLSGHYLRYQLVYSDAENCKSMPKSKTAYLCLQKQNDLWSARLTQVRDEADCVLYIKGTCTIAGFSNGSEKFYVPEQYATLLERELKNKDAAIKMMVSNDGQVTIKDLLIGNISWQEYIGNTK